MWQDTMLREQERLHSFRNVIVVTTLLMTVLAIGIAVTGFLWPALIPLCFAPEDGGAAVVVCPTGQSESITLPADIDPVIESTVSTKDLIVSGREMFMVVVAMNKI